MDMLNDIGFDLDNLGFEQQELETIVFQPDHNSREWLDTEEHWQDMPSFDHEDQSPYKSLTVNFVNKESMDKFFQLIKQDYTEKTKYIWYPKIEKNVIKDKAFFCTTFAYSEYSCSSTTTVYGTPISSKH